MSLLPAVLAGAQVAQGIVQANQSTKNVQKQIDFQREMYDKQKADNLAFWNQQNEYNSPQQQMQRLKQGGLNPNLVYGNGSVVANAAPAQQMRAPDPQKVDFSQQQSPLAGALAGAATGAAGYIDLRARQAQTDNLKAQNQAIIADAINKQIDGQQKAFNLGKAGMLLDSNLQAAQLANQKATADINLKEAQTGFIGANTELAGANTELSRAKLTEQLSRNIIADNESYISSATRDTTVKQAIINLLARSVDIQAKKVGMSEAESRILLNGGRLSNLSADTRNKMSQNNHIRQQLSVLIEAENRLRMTNGTIAAEQSRRESMDDRAWIGTITGALKSLLGVASDVNYLSK